MSQGTHLFYFMRIFHGRKQRGDIMFSFLREGLRSGAKCLCAFDAADRDTLHAEVNAQVDVASAGDQLDIVLPADLYLKRSDFSAQDMIDYWDGWAIPH